MAVIPADPRSAQKCHDRPVTPEVAGSSPVAPVENVLQIGFLLPILAQSTAGFLTGHALIPHANLGRGSLT